MGLSGTGAGAVSHILVVFPVRVPTRTVREHRGIQTPTLEVSNLSRRCWVLCWRSQCSVRANVPVLALDNWYFLIMTREKFFVQPKPERQLLAPKRRCLTAAFGDGQEIIF